MFNIHQVFGFSYKSKKKKKLKLTEIKPATTKSQWDGKYQMGKRFLSEMIWSQNEDFVEIFLSDPFGDTYEDFFRIFKGGIFF